MRPNEGVKKMFKYRFSAVYALTATFFCVHASDDAEAYAKARRVASKALSIVLIKQYAI